MKLSLRKMACAAGLLGVSFALVAMDGTVAGANVLASINRIATDPLSVLAARSPGARAGSRLRSTKQGHHASAKSVAPAEFMSSAVGGLPGAASAPPAEDEPAAFAFLPDVTPGPAGNAPTPATDIPSTPHGGGFTVPFIPVFGGGGAGGGGGGGGGRTDSSTIPSGNGDTTITSVPEPGSWLLLTGGLFLVGAGLRGKRVRLAGR